MKNFLSWERVIYYWRKIVLIFIMKQNFYGKFWTLFFYCFTLCYCDEAVDVGQYKYKTVRDNFEKEWQLTIYKRKYKTPKTGARLELCGKFFPDRFVEILMLISFC